MRNHHSTYVNVGNSIGRRAAVRSIFAGIIMLSASTAVMDTAEAQKHTRIQPGFGYVQAPVGHRQPTQDDVTGAGQIDLDKRYVEKDNELLDRPSTQDHVIGADEVQSAESALAKTIEQENARIDRLLRGICRGC
jgi:hypothetical protein